VALNRSQLSWLIFPARRAWGRTTALDLPTNRPHPGFATAWNSC